MPTSLTATANPLIASDKVVGTSVFDSTSTQIGEIQKLMINKQTGKVAYAILTFGGFLGIGASNYPLPWEALTYVPDLGGYLVNVVKERLERAPNYLEEEDPFVDPAYGSRVEGFWLT